jgi:hypothetical protein
MAISFVALFFFTAAPASVNNNEPVTAFKNSLFCNPGEVYDEQLGMTVYSGTRSMGREFTAYCVDDETGTERDVTGRSFAIMAGSFAVPFVLGLLLSLVGFTAGINRAARRITRGAMQGQFATLNDFSKSWGQTQDNQPVRVYTRGGQSPNSPQVTVVSTEGRGLDDLPPQAADMVRQMMAGFGATAEQASNFNMPTGGDLTERLRQLQEARDQGLISEQEFQRIRQQILDSLDN